MDGACGMFGVEDKMRTELAVKPEEDTTIPLYAVARFPRCATCPHHQ